MKRDDMFHDWLVGHLRKRLARDYKDVRANDVEQAHAHGGTYPDLILGNEGVVVAVMEVETESSIAPERVERWKELAGTGTRLILMVPAHLKPKVMDLVWKNGLVPKVTVATYDLTINM